MKSALLLLVLAIVACSIITTGAACPKAKYFKGTCNALTQDCNFHCTKLEGANSGQCVYKFPSFRCTCCR